MTLATAFSELYEQLESLHDLLASLRITVVEDKPLHDEHAVVERLDDITLGLQGYLEEALAAAKEGRAALNGSDGPDQARRSLESCQAQLEHFQDEFASGLAAYESLAALDRIGRGRKGEWQAWTDIVLDTVGRCQAEALRLNRALMRCWQEIAGRAGATSVSVRATNIGQQIAALDGWSSRKVNRPET